MGREGKVLGQTKEHCCRLAGVFGEGRLGAAWVDGGGTGGARA